MLKTKIAKAQKRYDEAKATTASCLAAIEKGGSYVLWRKAVVEEDTAKAKLDALLVQA
jgi:hypothetical protein